MFSKKKIHPSPYESGIEAVKDTVEKIVTPFNPIRLFELAFGIKKKQSNNLMGDYLQQIADPSLQDPSAYAQKTQETKMSDEQKMKQIQMMLHRQITAPVQKPQELRPYEQTMKELEERKAREIEQRQQSQGSLAGAGQGKKQGRLGMPMHQKAQTSMETKVNIKSG